MDALDLLLDPLRSGIGARALAEVALLGVVGGTLGFWVVTFGLAYGAESLAHSLLPGLVAAALLGLPLLGGAAAGVLAAAAVVGLAGRDERVGTDTATAVAVTGMLGLGGALALLPAAPTRLGELLFGDPLSTTPGDLIAAGALVVVVVAALAALYRPLTAVALDRAGARSLGLRPGAVLVALLGLLALTLIVAVQGLGNLLVVAVLLAPAAAVRRHTRSPSAAMAAGACVAVAGGVAGMYVSFHLEVAAGAAVALSLCVAALAGAIAPARRQSRPAS